MNDFFADNLEVLRQLDPQMADRLCRAVDTERVVRFPDGSLRYRYIQSYQSLSLGIAECEAAFPAEFSSADPFLVFGVGLGELPRAVLDKGACSVTAWDRDPFLFRLMLAAHDFRTDLKSGRLKLSLGVDFLSLLPLSDTRIVRHPLLAQVYKNENLLLDEKTLKPFAFVSDGALFVEDVSDALRHEGYSVYTLDVMGLSIEEIEESIQRARPKMLFRVNHIEGLASLSERMNLPTIEWEIDPALTDVQTAPETNAHTQIFTWRRRHVQQFQKVGFCNVQHLPLAANPARRFPVALSPNEQAEYASALAFVGASMAHRNAELRSDFLAAWATFCPDEVQQGAQVLNDVLSLQRQDFSRYTIPEFLAMRAPGMHVSAGQLDPVRIAGELAAAERRLKYIEALAPLGVSVWGDEAWKHVPGITWRGPAEHGVTINKIYSNAFINIDIGRLYQLDIVTMRVFDVLACGGFMLAEHSDELAELFDVGKELDSWRSIDELLDKSRWYLNNPDVAKQISLKGYEAVCERHTIRKRVHYMLRSLDSSHF
jgi:spore maturation protein CgeB